MSSSGGAAAPVPDGPIRSWDDFLEQAERDQGYPADLKASIPGAVQVVRREIGELDRKGPLGMDSRYLELLGNRAPRTRWFLVWLAQLLERAKSCPGYEGVRARLSRKGKIREAFELFETAEVFLDAGLEVEFEPHVEVEGSPRRPDLLVKSRGGERLFVEVKHLHDPKVMTETNAAMTRMAFVFMEHAIQGGVHVRHAGIWFRSPDGEVEWRAVQAAVKSTAERAHATKQIAECSFGDVIEFAFASGEAVAQLDAWASRRGLKVGECVGPEFDPREQFRLANTTWDASGQLPRDTPGMVFIYDQRHQMRAHDAPPICGRSRLHAQVARHPNLLGVVVCSTSFFGPALDPDKPMSWLWRTLASREIFPGHCLEYELVDNLRYGREVPRQILREVYRAIAVRHRRGVGRIGGAATATAEPDPAGI